MILINVLNNINYSRLDLSSNQLYLFYHSYNNKLHIFLIFNYVILKLLNESW